MEIQATAIAPAARVNPEKAPEPVEGFDQALVESQAPEAAVPRGPEPPPPPGVKGVEEGVVPVEPNAQELNPDLLPLGEEAAIDTDVPVEEAPKEQPVDPTQALQYLVSSMQTGAFSTPPLIPAPAPSAKAVQAVVSVDETKPAPVASADLEVAEEVSQDLAPKPGVARSETKPEPTVEPAKKSDAFEMPKPSAGPVKKSDVEKPPIGLVSDDKAPLAPEQPAFDSSAANVSVKAQPKGNEVEGANPPVLREYPKDSGQAPTSDVPKVDARGNRKSDVEPVAKGGIEQVALSDIEQLAKSEGGVVVVSQPKPVEIVKEIPKEDVGKTAPVIAAKAVPIEKAVEKKANTLEPVADLQVSTAKAEPALAAAMDTSTGNGEGFDEELGAEIDVKGTLSVDADVPFEAVQAPKAQSVDVERAAPRPLTLRDTTKVIQQVTERIELMAATRPKDGITIHLNPVDLGSISMTVKTVGSMIDTQILASNNEVRKALELSQPQLAAQMESRGFKLNNVTFGNQPDHSQANAGESSMRQQYQQQQQQHNQQQLASTQASSYSRLYGKNDSNDAGPVRISTTKKTGVDLRI